MGPLLDNLKFTHNNLPKFLSQPRKPSFLCKKGQFHRPCIYYLIPRLYSYQSIEAPDKPSNKVKELNRRPSANLVAFVRL